MTDRITQSMLSTTLLSDLQGITDRLAQTQEKLSSGKEISKPSDDPFATERALTLRAELASNKQYQTNVGEASSWQDATDTALGQVNDLVQRARDLTVQGANGSLSDAARKSIAAEIDQLIDSIKTAANTQYAGSYIFAGTQTGTAPYKTGGTTGGTPAPDDTYYGAAPPSAITREIGQGVQVQVNVVGASAFGDGTSGLIHDLRTISTDLQQANGAGLPALQTTDLQNLDKDLDLVTTTRATVGALSDRLQTALSRLQQLQESTTKLLSDTEDADVAKTMVDFSQQQAVYQAALRAGAQIIQPSLMDFLR